MNNEKAHVNFYFYIYIDVGGAKRSQIIIWIRDSY
jgi:hypothetical protein